MPKEIWVSVSGDLVFGDGVGSFQKVIVGDDFFRRRRRALDEAYLLIGKDVINARVLESNVLQIDLGGKSLFASSDEEDNLEEVWEVMSDTPDTSTHHRWHVALDDEGVLSARLPT